MVRRLTTGDLCALGIIDEDDYNVTPSEVPEYGGTMGTLTDKTAWMTEDMVECGSRVMARELTGYSTGFSAAFRMRRQTGSNFLRNWFIRALGGTSPSHELPSFTALAKIDPNSTAAWTGSTIDTLTISQAAVGAAIQVQVDAVSAWYAVSPGSVTYQGPFNTTKSLPIDRPVVPTGAPETRATVTLLGNTGSELSNLAGVKAWSLSIANALQSVPAPLELNGSEEYGAALGGAYPSSCDITLDITMPAQEIVTSIVGLRNGSTYHNASAVVTIGEVTLTLTGLTIDPAQPARNAEGPYDDTLKIRAKTIEVS